MKKNVLYRTTNILLAVIYIIALYIQAQFKFFGFNLQQVWFALFCFFVFISLMVKVFIFRSDSSLWLAVCLLLISVAIVLFEVQSLTFKNYWPAIFIVIALPSLVTGLVFKEIYQIKLFFGMVYASVPGFLFSLDVLNVWWALLIGVGAVVLFLLTNLVLPQRWYANGVKK